MFRGMVRVVTERERREEDGSYGFTSQAPVVYGGLPWWRCYLWVAATAHVMCARNGRDSRTTSFLPVAPRKFSLSLKLRLEVWCRAYIHIQIHEYFCHCNVEVPCTRG